MRLCRVGDTEEVGHASQVCGPTATRGALMAMFPEPADEYNLPIPERTAVTKKYQLKCVRGMGLRSDIGARGSAAMAPRIRQHL